MNSLGLLCKLTIFVFLCGVKAQQDVPSSQDVVTSFRPSLAVVIGVLSIMFSLTFLLLVYAKFCHRVGSVHADQQEHNGLTRSRRFSGIDKTVIESLPFFRFSSLKGSKEGLECAVCLSKFEDAEILRLLPQCKHAFHINCVDQWLESHSSCPLCRHKIAADDPEYFTYSNSLRFLWNQSELREDSNLEIFVQREDERPRSSSRFSIGSSFRKSEKDDDIDKEGVSLIHEENADFHKFNHRITVSDAVFKNRWSSVSSSDLMFLNSEMVNMMSSNRFSSFEPNDEQFATGISGEDSLIMKIKEEMELKRSFETKINDKINRSNSSNLDSTSNLTAELNNTSSMIMSSGEKRSMSEIVVLPRRKNRLRATSYLESNLKEERTRRLWFPIARRTVQWFANREGRSQQFQNSKQSLNV